MRKIVRVILVLYLFACGKKQDHAQQKPGQEMESALKKTEILSPIDYNLIFDHDTVDDIPIELIKIGDLNVSSGQIVVCDPLVFPDMPPLLRTIKPGKYPIKIYVAKTKQSGNRFAVAKLEVTKNQAIKWVLALRAGEDISMLTEEGDYFGFPVDAGLGGFFDYEAGIEYLKFDDKFIKENPGGNIYNDFFAAEFIKNSNDQDDPNDVGDWINFTIPGSDLNITMFQSGYGDGSYPAYWGIDENGDVTSLVIDFIVLLWPEEY